MIKRFPLPGDAFGLARQLARANVRSTFSCRPRLLGSPDRGPLHRVYLSPRKLSLENRQRIQRHIDRFARDWSVKSRLGIGQIVAAAVKEDRSQLLLDLVKADLDLRAAAGERLNSNDYLELGSTAVHFAKDYVRENYAELDPESTRLLLSETCHRCGSVFTPGVTQSECPNCLQVSISQFPLDDEFFVNLGHEDKFRSRFSLKKVVGEGAFGIVYHAWDNELQRSVAVKMPKQALTGKKLLAREARAASRLRHPNIVKIFDVVETEDSVFVVSDFIEGETLSKYRQHQTIGLKDACRILLQLCEAMNHAHEAGVIHRDLKPSNIVMDEKGDAFVLDFGLSRSRVDSSATLLRKGVPIGTPAYMPPEQASGDVENVGPESDVYALGVIFFQLTTGHLPFSGDVEDILHDVIHCEPVSPAVYNKSIPAPINAIILKALEKNPVDRYPVAGAFAADIERYLKDQRVHAYPKTDSRIVKRWTRTWTLPIVACLLLCGIVYAWLNWPAKPNPNGEPVLVLQPVSNDVEGLEWFRRDVESGLFESAGEVHDPDNSIQLLPGIYRVKVRLSGGRNWQVWRTVPDESQLPVVRPGLPVKHVSWEPSETRDDEIVLPKIDFVASSPPVTAIAIPAGVVDVADFEAGVAVSPFITALRFDVSASQISPLEVTLADVQFAFPNAGLKKLDVDAAIAYCESKGTALLELEDYLMAYSKRIAFPNRKPDLAEWTATRRTPIHIEANGTVVTELPAASDEFLFVRKCDMVANGNFAGPENIAPHVVLSAPNEPIGFRQKWLD